MKPQDIALAIVLIAAAASQFALKEQRAVDAQRVVAVEPDFALLHRQASDALEKLRHAQPHLASTARAAF